MDTKPVFHGSDIEKICSYYNLKKEDIVKFGANQLQNTLIFFLPIRTENTLLFAIRFPVTAGSRLILYFQETVPVN